MRSYENLPYDIFPKQVHIHTYISKYFWIVVVAIIEKIA